MKTTGILSLLLLTCELILGCGGGGGNPSLPSTPIYAQTYISGVLQAWSGAGLSGNATSYDCTTGSTDCITAFAGQQTNSAGQFTLSTYAIPGDWGIAAQIDSQCSTGASYVGRLSSGVQLTLTCGQIDPSYPVVSPSSCTKTLWVNRDTHQHTYTSDCPSQVSINPGTPTYPTSYALSVIGYDYAGSQISSTSVVASSSTSIAMPTPTQPGYSVLVIRDPNTNAVLGSALFNYAFNQVDCYTAGNPYCPQ